jgi:hypothetical protein
MSPLPRLPLLIALVGAVLHPTRLVAQPDPVDWTAVARQIATQLALVRGERVLLVGAPESAGALVTPLREAIRRAGAVDLGAVAEPGTTPADWETDFTRDLAKRSGAARVDLLRTVDAAVMMPGAAAPAPIYNGMQQVLRSGHGRTVHFHWAGAYDESGTLLPTTPNVAAFYQRALLQTDYAALAAKQRAFEQALRGQIVHVTTPLGTDLRFRIGDRPVTRQDGDASAARATRARNLVDREVELPAGAIRVAPVEASVEGSIAFPPASWDSTRVEGLVLSFARGRVIGISATTGRDAVEREMTAGGPSARSFREFALGLNPMLVLQTDGRRWIPYYGYGAGVIRLSLGDNTELGGVVSGEYVRWNFFTDATVTVGNTVWVRDGQFVR